MNRTGLRVLPRLDSARSRRQQRRSNPIPDWATLFGSADSCACPDCASVHGAAAYFVDALHFLGERGVLSSLLARRPDLGEIELSCQNTDTTLPVVDLVNEILEERSPRRHRLRRSISRRRWRPISVSRSRARR